MYAPVTTIHLPACLTAAVVDGTGTLQMPFGSRINETSSSVSSEPRQPPQGITHDNYIALNSTDLFDTALRCAYPSFLTISLVSLRPPIQLPTSIGVCLAARSLHVYISAFFQDIYRTLYSNMSTLILNAVALLNYHLQPLGPFDAHAPHNPATGYRTPRYYQDPAPFIRNNKFVPLRLPHNPLRGALADFLT